MCRQLSFVRFTVRLFVEAIVHTQDGRQQGDCRRHTCGVISFVRLTLRLLIQYLSYIITLIGSTDIEKYMYANLKAQNQRQIQAPNQEEFKRVQQ